MGVQSFKKYASAIDAQHNMWGAISRATGPLYAAYVVLLECGILFLVPLGGWMFVHGSITAGVLLLFAFIGTQYLTDIRPLQELASNLSYVLNGVAQVRGIFDTPVFGQGKSFPKEHDIELSDVTFGYTKDKTVLNHVSLHIGHGERVAFVGQSGEGKTTLVQLISRFYDVTGGSIKIGGIDVRELDYEQLLQNVSVVFQQSFLTRGTVFENIAMGDHTATLEQVRAAAKEAQIDEFIQSLPDGYETKVGSYGTRFSGGQKQRICIARAILKNAPILILEFRDVCFSYVEGEPVLKGTSFTIQKHELTAIVGDSGTGKSTILNLISKYYRPQSGRIVIGGCDIANAPSEQVLQNISLVDQDVFLFNDSVRNNIRYARPEATDREIEEACRLANCDGFIRAMEKEYDTEIGENGSRLSGGERQRLSIARAILRNAPIVLLDEATASLDIENELAVKQAIANLLHADKTVVMIAHTLSIVCEADQILVLDGGRITESGTHDALVKKNGKYAAMWRASQTLK